MDEFCTWTEKEDGTWTTECDCEWVWVNCNMEHLGMQFCCVCGLPLKTVAYGEGK